MAIASRSLAQKLQQLTEYLTVNFLGGPKWLKFSWVINAQKVTTFMFIGALMYAYNNYSPSAWVYLALHGGYGLVWLFKDVTFPDPNWQKRVTFAGALTSILGVLGWYWLFGWLLISGYSSPKYPLADNAWFALCIFLNLMGCVIMIAADAQKFYTLRLQKGLITDGVFRYIRHPNYLGEMMIYGSFALMVWHWIPAVVLACIWSLVFAVNMLNKERSMARYPEWAAYKKRSYWLIPFIF